MRAPPFNFEGFFFVDFFAYRRLGLTQSWWGKRTETATQPLADYTLEERLADLSGKNFVKVKQDKPN